MSSLTALSRSDGKFQEFMTTFRPEYPPNELHWKLRRSSRIHPAEGNGTRALMGVASTSGIRLPPLGAFFPTRNFNLPENLRLSGLPLARGPVRHYFCRRIFRADEPPHYHLRHPLAFAKVLAQMFEETLHTGFSRRARTWRGYQPLDITTPQSAGNSCGSPSGSKAREI